MMRLADATIRSGAGLRVLARAAAAAAFAAALAVSPALAQGQMRQGQGPGQGPRPPQQQQQKQAQPEDTELEQNELAPNHIDAFITTENALKPITSRLRGEPSKQQMAQMEAIAKKNGFKDFDEYGDVASNIGFVFSGINPESKKYEPEVLIKKEIDAVTGDARIPAPQKRQILAGLQQAQKSLPALKYRKNVELVAKSYDRMKPVMVDEPPQPPPQAQGQPRPQQPPRR
jgi:hypothetical protein